MRVQQFRKTAFRVPRRGRIDYAALLGVEIAGSQFERLPHISKFLDVHSERAAGANGNESEVGAVRNVKFERLPRQPWLAMLARLEDQAGGTGAHVTGQYHSQRRAARGEALAVARKTQPGSSCLLSFIENIQSRARAGLGPQVD